MCDMMTLLLHHHSTYTHSAAVKSGRRCQVYTAPLSTTSEKSVQFSPCVRVACMSPGAHYTTVYMYGAYGTCRDCVAVCCSVLQCVALCCSVFEMITVQPLCKHGMSESWRTFLHQVCMHGIHGTYRDCVAVCCSVLPCVVVC